MSSRRVVVTGMGIISPVGNDLETAWQKVVGGHSGIGPITDFDVSQFSTRFGGSIRDFDASQYVPAKELKKMDPFMHFGIAAASQAIVHAGLTDSGHGLDRIGVAMGSGIGGVGHHRGQSRATCRRAVRARSRPSSFRPASST